MASPRGDCHPASLIWDILLRSEEFRSVFTRWVAWWDSITSHHPESQEGWVCCPGAPDILIYPVLLVLFSRRGCILAGLVSWAPAGLRRLWFRLKVCSDLSIDHEKSCPEALTFFNKP